MDVTIAVGYARKSTDKQSENSIEYQKSAILKFCERNGLKLKSFYVDDALTGTNLNRQGLQELISDARKKKFNTVVIYDISRGSRDVGDWFTLRSLMAELGVRVVSVKQDLGDLMDPSNFIKEVMEVSIAQYEVLQARSKSIAGSKHRASKAKFMGGTPPLGYDIIQGQYVINPTEAKWVRMIHLMYILGATYKEILANIPEARSKRGNPLTETSIHAILKNPRYDGTYIWNEYEHKVMGIWAGRNRKPKDEVTKIEGGIPAIVTPEVKREVMARMADRRYGGRNAAKREYLLSGLIECEMCGGAFHGRTTKNSKGYETVTYVCGSKYNYKLSSEERCKAKNINAVELEAFVVAQLKHYLKTADFTEVAQEIAKQINNASADLKKEKSELAKITTKIRNGMQAILDGMYFPELQEEMDRLRVRKDELEEIIAKAKSNSPKIDVEDVIGLFRESVVGLENGNVAQVIRHHVTKIYAHADGSKTVNLGVCVTGCGGAQLITHTTVIFKAA